MPPKTADSAGGDQPTLIGELKFSPREFKEMDQLAKDFTSSKFKSKTSIERNNIVNKALLDLIMKRPKNCFVLNEVTNYMQFVSVNNILDGSYNQTAFERWLNQHSGLSYEENREIRGKIVGKFIPRDEYQIYFPVAHNKVYNNSHAVTAHNPPDLDSTTASFIGWMDAFACRVGGAMTIWNLPQGQPGPIISKLFLDIYGEAVFKRIAKSKAMISPVAMDLLRQNRFIKVQGESNIRDFQHKRFANHIVLVDDNGYYVGDWRVSDVDAVGRIQRLLNICLNILEKQVVQRLTAILSKRRIEKVEIQDFLNSIFKQKIPEHGMLLHRFSSKDYEQLDAYLKKVLGVKEGCQAMMENFFDRMDDMAYTNFNHFVEELNKLIDEDLYDPDKCLIHESHTIFKILNEAYSSLIESTKKSRSYFDRLDIAMGIKKVVLGYEPSYLTTKAEFNEVLEKMKDYGHITVCYPDKQDKLIPVGVIHREDLENPIQGTVTLRDFCNYDEIKVAKSIQVISAIDHHKSTMSSTTCMTLTVADVQSANVLVAEKAFIINDAYGTRGQSIESIDEQLKELNAQESTPYQMRLIEKLIRKKQAVHRSESNFFISPEREMQEYIFFLNAIIDDTDLLSKSGWRDILCVAELINRIKSILAEKEVEVLDISHYPRSPRYLKQAIREVLVNKDSYSFYKGIYDHREKVVDTWMMDPNYRFRCFEDRKIQNETCAVSQLKFFPRNRDAFISSRDVLLKDWFKIKSMVRTKSPEVDFFLHMTSTIPGAKEAYDGTMKSDGEEDEIWLSVNYDSDQSTSRFRQFLDFIKV
ncbi:MAG: hypothetical protein NE328_16520, partial [Lentisphaeraceae bacterium]|nr:hypothetical protein [Lentisphaeraceae bacterium]